MRPQGQAHFLVLEGMDGTGTTTISRLVADGLRDRDLRVCLTAEPTDGPLGRLLRSHLTGQIDLDPYATALVFSGDRADHLARTIRPALARGEWVVCDRYLLSTLAYQGAEGVSREAILAASATFAIPDLTVVLEVGDETRAARMSGRPDRERYEDPALDQALRTSYKEAIALLRTAGHTIEVIDGTVAPDDIAAGILRRLDTL
jgi:dTMP kinase